MATRGFSHVGEDGLIAGGIVARDAMGSSCMIYGGEPHGAVALAVALAAALATGGRASGKSVGVVISGGNLAIDHLPRLLSMST